MTEYLQTGKSPQHILVVEDDAAVGDMLSMLLETEGYHVTLVSTAYAALQELRLPTTRTIPSQPAVVLLDLQLPGMSGEDLIQQLHHAQTLAPPIIVLSAKHEQALEDAATLRGVAHVIAKPFLVDDLLERISAVLTP